MSKVKGPTITRYRDSVDGQFVKPNYADKNPRTTEREHIHVNPPKPKK